MKRLIIIASLAILAIGCQKTEIQNEVQTPISFSTEVGKQTRAIAQNTQDYLDSEQSFAVFGYGHQIITSTNPSGEPAEVTTDTPTRVINDVEYVHDNGKWVVNSNTKYYWPNDPRTKMNFYAYSPSTVSEGKTADAFLTGTVTHFEDANTEPSNTTGQVGFKLTDYTHSNMYLDFMVSTPVNRSTYSFPNGPSASSQEPGIVPVTFNHQMTQVVFVVTTDKPYEGVTFTVEEITLKNIESKATYTNESLVPNVDFRHGLWSYQNSSIKDEYTIFPALVAECAPVDADQSEEPLLSVDGNDQNTTIDENEIASMTTIPVTMIPQTMKTATSDVSAGTDTYATEQDGQMFMIKYSISGTGVAAETVIKHVPFEANANSPAIDWLPNMKITYTVKIGLNEIYFLPSVADWDDTDEKGTADTGDDEPWGDEFEFAQ